MSYVAATLQIAADEDSPRGYVLYSGAGRVDDKYLDLVLSSCAGGTFTFEAYTEKCQRFRKFDQSGLIF